MSSVLTAAFGAMLILSVAAQPAAAQSAAAQSDAAPAPVAAQEKTEKDGKYLLPDGTPTFNVKADGTVDWYTFSGFRRYHSECHVCHGPDGEGSSYAPALAESMRRLSYSDFVATVAGGREIVRPDKVSKMPALGDNSNVMCYIDDIYVYLMARADNTVPRGRPEKRDPKPQAATDDENRCFGRPS